MPCNSSLSATVLIFSWQYYYNRNFTIDISIIQNTVYLWIFELFPHTNIFTHNVPDFGFGLYIQVLIIRDRIENPQVKEIYQLHISETFWNNQNEVNMRLFLDWM